MTDAYLKLELNLLFIFWSFFLIEDYRNKKPLALQADLARTCARFFNLARMPQKPV
jgi:hypothetical protein